MEKIKSCCVIKCSNDWAQLKEIIVGTAKGYRIPELNRSFKSCQFPEYDEKDIQVGPYPDWVIEEAEEDLDLLAQTLSSHDVIVHRPDTTYNHPDNWHHYSPRDCTLVVGNTINIHSAENIQNNIIDYTNPYNTITRSSSSLSANWDPAGGIVFKNLDYQIRKGLQL